MNKIPEGKNRLALASSPYLKQHEDNPVDWYEWGEEAFARAREEDKPLLISIGYSSCHWCHVMAHESFEDTAVARVMNEAFINVKLDREERPDIDQIYMDAVQAMGLNGGWPLNVFVTPEQKPFYGGTYFPREKWLELVNAISTAFKDNREKLEESAEKFAEHLKTSELEKYGLTADEKVLTKEDFENSIGSFKKKFDPDWGGVKKAPKFPMPATWNWLADYYDLSGDEMLKQHFLFTLEKIAEGGIYDQIGGGFARYSVDDEWHVPHFEKMLYDNGQLLELYARGYQLEARPSYKKVLIQTMDWLEREMLDESGGFYSALDADSEGVEGKFYVWAADEIAEIAGDDHDLISVYYYVLERGNWEHTNVLRRMLADEEVADRFNISVDELRTKVNTFNDNALAVRAKRTRPGLDSKILSGWNGLLLSGLSATHKVLRDDKSKRLAQNLAAFLSDNMVQDNRLIRGIGKDTEGFLEDYGAIIKGFIDYYETFFDEAFLRQALALNEEVIKKFYDQEEELFFYTSSGSENLIARKKEIFDNVIPSSNALMAENLYRLSIYFDRADLRDLHQKMLNKVKSYITKDPEFMSYWAGIATNKLSKQIEISIVGPDYLKFAEELQNNQLLNLAIMASPTESELPLMQLKTTRGSETTIYVCSEKTCRRPVTTVADAQKEIGLLLR